MVMTGGEYMSPERLILHKIRKNKQKHLFLSNEILFQFMY